MDRQSAPMAEILGLMVRERLTGDAPPDGAKALVDILRNDIEAKAGKDLDRLAAAIDDQAAFARSAARSCATWTWARRCPRPPKAPTRTTARRTSERELRRGPGRRRGRTARRLLAQESETSDRETEAGDEEMVQSEQDGDPRTATRAPRWATAPSRPAPTAAGQGGEPLYKIFTTAHDEIVAGRGPLRRRGADPAAGLSRPAAVGLSSVVSRLANKLQRRLLAQQNRAWTFDLEEGMLDVARLTRVIIDPTAPLSFKQEEDQEFRDTVVTLLIDNSGSMRGRPIMVAASAPTSWPARWSAAASRPRCWASPPAPGRAGPAATSGSRPASPRAPAA
jgi:cobaltochelatase CobT